MWKGEEVFEEEEEKVKFFFKFVDIFKFIEFFFVIF